ncbi:XRE family transcriptional regulator [Sulfuricurvum sp.]|uniref:XRE family transcriptional regulator n=1 Tax=Sulfuricurvum sp. TaxID=2025608 RepID=UPI002625A746|nr:XRE family transcriptional regulator [Sulfuricurvum sp.]MDD2267051.1 XRE family transcriptional regulator [Sulfuricurvum sp.]MDD2784944.1 XRE family transcriptional regulator [Sulfuricurvum sp.]
MDRDSFNQKLNDAKLSRKEFAALFGLNYQSVNGWGSNDREFPYWVESWLDLYIENEKYKRLKSVIKDIQLED